MQWNKTYGGTNSDIANFLVQTIDGGFALAGTTKSYGAGGVDNWLVMTDAEGNILSRESGLVWVDSTADTVTLYRCATDSYWNYVRVRILKAKE